MSCDTCTVTSKIPDVVNRPGQRHSWHHLMQYGWRAPGNQTVQSIQLLCSPVSFDFLLLSNSLCCNISSSGRLPSDRVQYRLQLWLAQQESHPDSTVTRADSSVHMFWSVHWWSPDLASSCYISESSVSCYIGESFAGGLTEESLDLCGTCSANYRCHLLDRDDTGDTTTKLICIQCVCVMLSCVDVHQHLPRQKLHWSLLNLQQIQTNYMCQ